MSTEQTVGVDLQLSEAELDATREHITSFIRDRVAAAGVDGAVIGLSGGIDSTLTAHLAVEALGSEAVRGLVMPSTVDVDENMSDAERVALELEMPHDVVPIQPIVDAFLDAYPDGIGREEVESDPLRTAVGNVRVRTRAVLNYFVANNEHRLVLGTGNRTEALVGYFTKYGDGAVDCLPIGNLYKQQVRQLARHVGVPVDLVEKTPTAGMWSGQTDEEELGLDYDTLDAILALTVDGRMPTNAAAQLLDGVAVETIERVHDLYYRSAHKRAVPPAPDPRR